MSKRSRKEIELLGNGAGLLAEFWLKLTAEVKNLGGSVEDMYVLSTLRGQSIISQTASLIMKQSGNIIKRIVRMVDYSRMSERVLIATGRELLCDDKLFEVIPKVGSGIQKDVIVEFFKIDRWATSDEVAQEYDNHGLTPDLFAQADVNREDLTFADKHPNSCLWKDAQGKWCYASFFHHSLKPYFKVGYKDGGWDHDWWFGGVRKSSTNVQRIAG